MSRRLCECGKPTKLDKTVNGVKRFKLRCATCHAAHFAKKKGLTSTAWTNSFHPYLKYRKDYCENTGPTFWDALIAEVNPKIEMPIAHKQHCTSRITISAQLQVDHKDGNPEHNDPSNLHTLCSICHTLKTLTFGDAHTIGRATLKKDRRRAKLECKEPVGP